MKSEDITLQTVTVDIQVVRVGGKQMTKSVFMQIETPPHIALPTEERTSAMCDAEVSTIIGYINLGSGAYWLLYINKAGRLRRAPFEHWGYENYATLLRSLKDRSHLFIAI